MKRAVEILVVRSRVSDVAGALVRPRGVVLAYHNVVPEGEPLAGERSLHVPERLFRRQLEVLLRRFDVVPLEELFALPGRRPRGAITFDDAYRGAVTAGVAALAALGLPATIFVPPGCLGGRSFWWDRLAGPAGGVLPASLRRRALEELRGEEEAIGRWAEAQGLAQEEPPAHARGATVEELAAAVARAGIRLGSHGWSHANLARLTPAELEAELVRPLAWLRDRFPDRLVPWLSYPYGRPAPAVRAVAAAAGYRAAVRVEGGGFRRGIQDPYGVPRLNVPAGLSADGLALRLAAWWWG